MQLIARVFVGVGIQEILDGSTDGTDAIGLVGDLRVADGLELRFQAVVQIDVGFVIRAIGRRKIED